MLGLILSVTATASVITTLKYERAIVACQDDGELRALLKLCFCAVLPMVVVAVSGAFALRSLGWLGLESLSVGAVLLTLPLLLLISVQQVLRYYQIRLEEYMTISKQAVIQGASKTIFQLVFGWLVGGWFFLVGGEVVGIFAAVLWLISSRRRLLDWWRLARFEDVKKVAYKYREFPLFSLTSNLIGTSATTLRMPLILDLFGSAAGGQFTLMQRVVAAPTSLIGTAVGDTYHGRAARYFNHEPASSIRFFWKTSASLFFLGLVPFTALALWGPDIFSLVFGRNWGLAGEIASRMAPLAFVQFVVSPMSRSVDVFGGQRFKLIFDGLSLSCFLGLYFVAPKMNWDLLYFVQSLAVVFAALYFLYFLIVVATVYSSVKRRIGRTLTMK